MSEIYSAHLLEHFPEEELSRELLPYWYSLLRPGAGSRPSFQTLRQCSPSLPQAG